MYHVIQIFRYVTKGTFDAYNWSLIENKQHFISPIMTGAKVGRKHDDIDEAVLSYAEMKAIASGNPMIREKMEIDNEVTRLKSLKNSYIKNRHTLQYNIERVMPQKLEILKDQTNRIKADIQKRNANPVYQNLEKQFQIRIGGITYNERNEAGSHLLEVVRAAKINDKHHVGEICGFNINIEEKLDTMSGVVGIIEIQGNYTYCIERSNSEIGNMTRVTNLLKSMDEKLLEVEQAFGENMKAYEDTKKEYQKPFLHEKELLEKLRRQRELEKILDSDNGRGGEMNNVVLRNKAR